MGVPDAAFFFGVDAGRRPFFFNEVELALLVVLLAPSSALDDVGFFGVVVFRDDDFGVDFFDDDGVVVVCRDDRRVGVAMLFRSSSSSPPLSLSVCVLCVSFACARPGEHRRDFRGGECNNAREKRTDKFFVRFFFLNFCFQNVFRVLHLL